MNNDICFSLYLALTFRAESGLKLKLNRQDAKSAKKKESAGYSLNDFLGALGVLAVQKMPAAQGYLEKMERAGQALSPSLSRHAPGEGARKSLFKYFTPLTQREKTG